MTLSIFQIGEILAIAGLLFAAYTYWHSRFIIDLSDPITRQNLADRLAQTTFSQHYENALHHLKSKWDGFFSENWSRQTFTRCLQIAFLYPLGLFMLAWALGGPHQMSGIAMFSEDIQTGWPRIWRAATLFMSIISLYVLAKDYGSSSGRLHRLSEKAVKKLSKGKFRTFVKEAVEGVPASAGLVAFVYIWAIISEEAPLEGAGTVAAGAVVAGALVRELVVTVAVVGAFVALEVITGVGAGVEFLPIIIFLIILPSTNALLDTVSWSATRHFIGKMLTTTSRLAVVLEIIADIAIALICLFLLAALIPNVIELFNLILPAPFDWIGTATDALADPFGAGLLTTGMLLSTLVPTFIHVTAGIGALGAGFAYTDFCAAVARDLASDAVMDIPLRSRAIRALMWHRLWLIPASLVVLALSMGFYYLLSWVTGPIGQLLFDWSICATAWATDQTCEAFFARF